MRHLVTLLGLLLPFPALGQEVNSPADRLALSGSLRARYELLDGQARAGLATREDIVALRTLILAQYRTGDWDFAAELQDSRVYGAEERTSVTANDVNAFELVQARVRRRFGPVLGPGSALSVTTGRMTIALGSRRLIAADEYRNTTQGSTGVRIEATLPGKVDATAIYVLPQRRLPDAIDGVLDNRVALDREGFDLQLFGAIVAKRGAIGRVTLEASGFGLIERDTPGRPTRDRRLGTASVRAIADPAPGRIDFEVEAIGQWGTSRTSPTIGAPQQQVAASFFHADIGYSFAGPARLRLSLEYDRASGDAPGGGNGRFDTLFGMRRADLAPAGLYAQIGRANISTPALRIEAAPGKRLDGFVATRALWLAERTDAFSTTGVRDATGGSGSFAGHQVEGRLRWWALPRRVRIEGNAVLLAKGRFLRAAPNAAPVGDVAYLSLAVTTGF